MKLPKIALGAWAWGSGTVGGNQIFGHNLEAKDLKPIFDAANGGRFKFVGYCDCLRYGRF